MAIISIGSNHLPSEWPSSARNTKETTLLAFMAGTLYGLARAVELGFRDDRMTPDLANTRSEARSTFAGIVEGSVPADPGLSDTMLTPPSFDCRL